MRHGDSDWATKVLCQAAPQPSASWIARADSTEASTEPLQKQRKEAAACCFGLSLQWSLLKWGLLKRCAAASTTMQHAEAHAQADSQKHRMHFMALFSCLGVTGCEGTRVRHERCAAGSYMNGARHESPFTLDDLDTTPAEQKHQNSAAQQESQNGNPNGNANGNANGSGNGNRNGNGYGKGKGNANGSQHSVRGMNAPRAGDLLDSMDASDLWLDAGVCQLLPCICYQSAPLQECSQGYQSMSMLRHMCQKCPASPV